jgi:hypothetical protein
MIMENKTITLEVEKFKEILLFSWHLLPADKQQELAEMGIHPQKVTPSN